MLAACAMAAATTAFAQFVENGGQAGSADTAAFGQANAFSNVTTTFDGIEFQLQRLIRDPKDKANLRAVGQLVNTGDSDRWIFFIGPAPRLVDELGNLYYTARNSENRLIVSGVSPCLNSGYWTNEVIECRDRDNSATRLAPKVAITIIMGFEPSTDSVFDASLASIATSTNLSLRFALSAIDMDTLREENSTDSYRAAIAVHEVTIPQIPMPASE